MKTNSVLDRGEGLDMLDLTYLASGRWQHVFTKTGDVDDIWLYKLPAMFGYLVRTEPTDRIFWPRNRLQTGLRFVLTTLPCGLYNKVVRLNARLERGYLRKFATALKPITYLAVLVRSVGFTVLAAHCKSMRRQRFWRMLRVLEYLAAHGLCDVLLPFKIVRNGRAILRADGVTMDYRGPILVQRRAASLFEIGGPFRCFDWSEFVQAEHRLWRHGVALGNSREALGPWGLLDGHVRLFDTSCLTRDYRVARRCLRKAILDRREKLWLQEGGTSGCVRRELTGTSRTDAVEYFRVVRRDINQERLEQLWRADLPKKASVRSPMSVGASNR